MAFISWAATSWNVAIAVVQEGPTAEASAGTVGGFGTAGRTGQVRRHTHGVILAFSPGSIMVAATADEFPQQGVRRNVRVAGQHGEGVQQPMQALRAQQRVGLLGSPRSGARCRA